MNRVNWVLRLGVAGEFIGHGWVGTGRPVAWLPFFHLFSVNDAVAFVAMPLIGVWDICVGVLMLASPLRGLLIWTSFWGLFTALLRPAAGQGWWEFFERAANFGVPMSLLLLALAPAAVAGILRFTVASLLIGHGAIGAFTHPAAWNTYFNVLGVNSAMVAQYSLIELVGWFEIALGVAVLIQRGRGLLVFVCCWKITTEILRPLAGEEPGQFIERAASYAAPVGLAMLEARTSRSHLIEQLRGLATWLAVAARHADPRRLTVLCLTMAVVAAALFPGTMLAQEDHDICWTQSMFDMTTSQITADARLCTSDSGVQAAIHAENLTRASAYTTWFVYFDEPGNCEPMVCSGVEVLSDDAVAVVTRMDEVVADRTGTARFFGDWSGVHLSPGSQVWMLLRGEGPATTTDNRLRARQLLTSQWLAGNPASARGEYGIALAIFDLP